MVPHKVREEVQAMWKGNHASRFADMVSVRASCSTVMILSPHKGPSDSSFYLDFRFYSKCNRKAQADFKLERKISLLKEHSKRMQTVK